VPAQSLPKVHPPSIDAGTQGSPTASSGATAIVTASTPKLESVHSWCVPAGRNPLRPGQLPEEPLASSSPLAKSTPPSARRSEVETLRAWTGPRQSGHVAITR